MPDLDQSKLDEVFRLFSRVAGTHGRSKRMIDPLTTIRTLTFNLANHTTSGTTDVGLAQIIQDEAHREFVAREICNLISNALKDYADDQIAKLGEFGVSLAGLEISDADFPPVQPTPTVDE